MSPSKELSQEQKIISDILFPSESTHKEMLLRLGVKSFAYYTSAETACKILKNREIWMRNASTMNDYSECIHGLDCLREAYNDAEGQRLKEILEPIHPGISQAIETHFNAWIPHILKESYIACVSEHLPQEDLYGRLSMWRAYGGNGGVALVMRGQSLFEGPDIQGITAQPVRYLKPSDFVKEFALVVDKIQRVSGAMAELDSQYLQNCIFSWFRFAVLCTKHPGFAEEREWRVMACPLMYRAPCLRSDIEVVRGTPQKVLKFPFRDQPEHGVIGFELDRLFEYAIVGPCSYPDVVRDALAEIIRESGIRNPFERVVVSDIPLRLVL